MRSISPFQRSERDPLWRREMRERWRRPITLFFLTLYVAGLCWFAYSLYSSVVPVGNVQLSVELRGIGHQIFISLLSLQIGAWIPFALLLSAPTIAAERERRALIEYFLAGLLPQQIVRAKFASISTFIVVMCAVPLPVLALCFPLGGVEPLELFAGVLLEIALAIVCAAIGLLISVSNRRVTSAMQQGAALSLVFLFFAVLLLRAILELPFGVWFILAGFLALIAGAILRGCEDALDLVSRDLEQDESPRIAPSLPSLEPDPIRILPRFQDLQITPEKTRQDYQMEGPPRHRDSSWDLWIEQVAAWNAVAQREVRVGLRASRLRMALYPDRPTYQFSPWAWVFFGVCGAAVVGALQMVGWWYLGLTLATIMALVAATSGASAAFTREREQKMLAQLQMCPLSPLEIVVGKIVAMLLLVTRSWGGLLLGLFVVGLSQGVGIAFSTAIIVILSLLFATALATLLSLLCHHTAIATGGTLGSLVVLFVLLPSAPSSLIYFVPWLRVVLTSFPIGPMWIEPMGVILNPSNGFFASSLSLPEALFRMVCSLLVLNALLIFAATVVWAHTSPDDGEAKTRFWERDISRSWR
ncbi:hypothetical protein IAD21_02048 [Abditibacteriota bacterium]|nr:hypothetical protein IAD21_02048 [Abditibacteriota bacterium]